MKQTPKNVLSLFDGIACARQALERVGITIENYFASEINPASMKVAKHRYPDIHHVGDVRFLRAQDLPMIKLLTGGSPCQDFSIIGTKKGMTTKCKIKVDTLEKYLKLKSEGFEFEGSSYLFWEFVRLWKELNPPYFFLENVKMNQEWENLISETLGVTPHAINSSLVSAQHRERLYWTNIPLTPIVDLGIEISHVIPDAIVAAGKRGQLRKGMEKYVQMMTHRKDKKSNCVVTQPYNINKYMDIYGDYKTITPEHAELLQTITHGYTNVPGVCMTDRYEMVGNAWTVDVITKFFENLKS